MLLLMLNILYWMFSVCHVKITDLDREEKFSQLLTSLLDEHKDVVSMLADGFCQSRDYIGVSTSVLARPLPLPSARQHPSYGDCLEVKREYYQNNSVLDCVTQLCIVIWTLIWAVLTGLTDWVCQNGTLTLCIEAVAWSWSFFLPSARQRLSYGDCLEVKREYCQTCSVLDCVTQLCTVMHTDMSSSYRWTDWGLGFCVFLLGQFICVRVGYFVFSVFRLCYCLVVSTSAIDSLERLVSEMTCYVSSGMINPTHLLTEPVFE